MGAKLYLTIDDGPSPHFRALVDFLHQRGVPAAFFNRGDHMQARPDDVVYGITKGYLMANHGYAHQKASVLSFEQTCADLLKAEAVLDRLYAQAGAARPGKYIRFPYMDRGMGPALSETVPPQHAQAVNHLIIEGLGHAPRPVTPEDITRKNALQEFLRAQGFAALPTPGVTLEWYNQSGLADTIDSLCTFSTSDWVMNERHLGRFGFNGIDDLKAKIDRADDLKNTASAHIVLMHDGPELFETATALVDHFLVSGFEFLDFSPE